MMTVAELRKKLKEFPGDMEVQVLGQGGMESCPTPADAPAKVEVYEFNYHRNNWCTKVMDKGWKLDRSSSCYRNFKKVVLIF
jgi:hypothetical protein